MRTSLDGEVVAIDEEGRPSFQALQHRTSLPLPVVYYAFDLLHRDGRDLRSQPLEGRKGELAEVIDESGVYIPDSLPGALDDVIAIRAARFGTLLERSQTVFSRN
jgi:bifunctional non-homologous end joining protein LigD